ncbi:hypothetical protein [Cellulomonas sp. URHD0024]|uniref:hypothetical protein n=1 Tax=Cellulomonas sp. URHD0024 TaxID=1302620 RepID=UPI00040A2555|nr:hypothetical protein [Cellulomonas sp. URHD0024]
MSGQSGASRAVFVDPSGRRGRTVRRIMWTLGALAAAYAVLVVAALVIPVGMNRLAVPGLGPLLPGPAAPALGGPAGGDEGSLVPASPPPTVTPSPSASVPARAPAGTARTVVGTPAPPPPAIPAADAATAPAPTPVQASTPGSSAAAPGSSGTAPGQSGHRPGNAPTAKPEPASTHAATPTPRPNKR